MSDQDTIHRLIKEKQALIDIADECDELCEAVDNYLRYMDQHNRRRVEDRLNRCRAASDNHSKIVNHNRHSPSAIAGAAFSGQLRPLSLEEQQAQVMAHVIDKLLPIVAPEKPLSAHRGDEYEQE